MASLRAAFRFLKPVIHQAMRLPGLRQSEQRLAGDAQRYWQATDSSGHAYNSHWRGAAAFADDSKWLALGVEHLNLIQDYARLLQKPLPVSCVIEWGCGGGANAVHFGRLAERFIGVDVSPETLDECQKQMTAEGLTNFHPLLVDLQQPERSLDTTRNTADVWLCTYVFELIPSQAYGRRLLDIAYAQLKPGGMAIVQIKYATAARRTHSRTWGYKLAVANMTSFFIDEFWTLARSCGFTPKAVTLQPKQEIVQDERYAYFILVK